MTDYLLRDQAPLTREQWERLDKAVEETARRALVGRRIVPVSGPLRAGIQVVAEDVFRGADRGTVDLLGEADPGVIRASGRRFLPLPMLYKDFRLHWRDLETQREMHLAIDTGPAEAAAAVVARTEDDMIFNGSAEQGLEGLL